MDRARRQLDPLDFGSVLLLHGVALAALLIARGNPPPMSATAPIMAQLIQAPAAPPAPPVSQPRPKLTPPLAMRTPVRPPKPVAPPKPATPVKPVPVTKPKAEPRPLTTTAAQSPREIAPAPIEVPRPAPTPPTPPDPAPSPTATAEAAPLPAPSPIPPAEAAAAATTATRATAPTVTPRRTAGTTGKPADNRAYFAALLQRLNRFKVYPPALRKEKIEGRVVLKFTIDAQGSVIGSSVDRSSGNAALDDAAERMLARASPLPAIPASMGKSSLTLSVPIEYSLLTDR